jgi:SPP1 gp7 family putative phage head morphogenesis protein
MFRSLSPRSPSRGAVSHPQSAAADSKSFIELGAAVQTSDANDLVLVDGEGVRALGSPPRSPLSPPAFLRSKQASAARSRIADRFARALPTGVSRDQAAVPFNNLTDAGAVRVHQLRLLAALVKFQQDLIKGGMGESQAAELSTLLKGNAEAAGVSHQLLLEGIQKRVNEMLAESIDKGGTFPEFAQLIADEAPGLGITNQNPAYVELVFRTNVLGAYGHGRHEAMSDPDVISARPFRQWRTSLDNRVREEHAAFESQVWRADDPAMSGLKTPAGFSCRCSVVSLSTWDGELATSVPPGLVTPGFE